MSSSKDQWSVESPWLDICCSLAEGPFYEVQSNSVRFVDILKNNLHSAPLLGSTADVQTTSFDGPVSVTCNIDGVDPRSQILIATKRGPAILNRNTNLYDLLGSYNEPEQPRLRANDGGCDPHGRFWIGTMTDAAHGKPQPEGLFHHICEIKGSLFVIDSKGKAQVKKTGLSIPNQISWSPDHRTMYFTHSSERRIYAMDYDTDTGDTSNERVFYQHEGPGEPDGGRVDVHGNLWHAIYGEASVLRINPEGIVTGQVSLPTRNITCVAFAGSELVITSAADEDGEEQSRRNGGAVFKVDVGVHGLEPFKFKSSRRIAQ